jgi:hypothetical protein
VRRLAREECHLYFDANEEPRIRVPPGSVLVVETEDAHMGTIRTEQDVYGSLAEVFEKLGGAVTALPLEPFRGGWAW